MILDMASNMNHNFCDVLAVHRERYPQMQPQDYVKLAFQSEFGPEHIVTDAERALSWILEEMTDAGQDVVKEPEWIGNGLCRFHLSALENPKQDAPLLVKLFIQTAQEHQGMMAGLESRLALLEALNIPGMKDWLKGYRDRGCSAVHHSEQFNTYYHPHYRLLKMEYALYFPVISVVSQLVKKGSPICIAVDGCCGSGKTSLSLLLQKLFDCNVFHMDDFYCPFEQRTENWTETPAGNMDLERFLQEVLIPIRKGRTVSYRRYDCQKAMMMDAELFAPTQLTVIDGSYSHHPMLADQYDLKVFLTCSRKEQERRLRIREGAYFEEGFQKFWIPMEERYHHAFDIEDHSSMVIDTGRLFGAE